MERRPGVAYRRPNGDPDRFVVEAGGEPRLDLDALPRTDWLEATAEADRQRLRSALDGGDVDVTYRLATGDGPLWVRECGRRDGDGDVVGYLLPAGEGDERRRRLERQRERLEEFASVVSHDLRNPLSVAVGNVELAKEFEGEAADERLDRAHDALDWMDDLISDLLALAREGHTVEETATVDLRAVVDAAWRTVGAGPEAALVVEDPLPTVECDRSRLRQALENLFRNAIEHGASDDCSPGEVSGEGDADVGDATSGSVEPADGSLRILVGVLSDGFYVADDGPGIEPSERESVFEPGHTTADDGTGFGLAIVERIAEAHGWSVSVTEGRAGGARFEFAGVESVDEVDSTESDRESVATEPGGSPPT
ncbi:HAMP domain-containing sensor histidine kinase [Halorubrum sp. Hd13]|uniref:sensor histidine kinase n=1 Tax=Halorubrum sp. Hd13 TaxID=1480728 RepID=UPI000B994830|nr:HAMP domain-containing sensor histidine kinase [Halorubrum sp. Hd13]OYR38301.1 sensor histidine kinase [Halorubrum sp. Hd13]